MTFVTGYGANDTHATILNDGRVNQHHNAGRPYGTVTLAQVVELARNPPQVDKAVGQWIIPSAYAGHDARTHAAQRENGSYGALAVDIDQGDHAEATVNAALATILGPDISRIWWSTPSSTDQNKKWRFLIPLAQPLPGEWYSGAQAALFDGLEAQGIHPDRTMERNGQVLYLANKGDFYDWGWCGQTLLTHDHRMFSRAEQYVLRAREVREHATNAARNEGSRSFLAAFRRRYSVADMLHSCGYTQRGGSDHWKSPYASGYSTQDMGDGWRSLSWTDQERGIGRPAATGNGCFGDQFDLYVHFHCNGDVQAAEAHARQCLQEEDDAAYGAATAQHGASLLHDGFCVGTPLGPGAQERLNKAREAEAAEAKALIEEASRAERQRWHGPWCSEIPFPVTPSKLEWLAWHAPGGIGDAVRAKSVQTSRHSLVPAMLGAVTLFMHIGQGKYVSRVRQHVTPCAAMIFQVGSSGSGKGDGTGTFYEMLSQITADYGIPARRVKSFASGQSLTDYLMHHSANVTIIQNEGGADRKAGKGNANFESLMAGVMDTYTSFAHGIEVTHTKSDEKEAKAIAHPTVGALQSSTPNKLFASIDAADGESGWLGRFMFISLTSTLTNKQAAIEMEWPRNLVDKMNNICAVIPPLPGTAHPDVWQGQNQAFHVIPQTQEVKQMFDDLTDRYDIVSSDERRGEAERAIYSRAFEATARLATVAALAKNRVIDAECVAWATMVVECSLDFVTAKLETVVEADDSDTPSSKVRKAIRETFRRADADEAFRAKLGNAGQRKGPDGEIQLGKNALRRRVKDNTKQGPRIITEELDALIEDGEIVVVNSIELNNARQTVWLKYLG